jgi:hypothetical protein
MGAVQYTIDALSGCEPTDCTPHSIPNSNKAGDDDIVGKVGDLVLVTCDDPLRGSGRVVCQDTGTFSSLVCSASSCDSTEVANSNYKIASSIQGVIGDTLVVVCDEGYSGGGVVTCLGTNEWSSVICSPSPCSPVEVLNSVSGFLIATTGSLGTVTCQDGFIGGGSSLCLPDGTFSHILRCGAVPCKGAFAGGEGRCVCAPGFFGAVSYVDGIPTGCEPCPAGQWTAASLFVVSTSESYFVQDNFCSPIPCAADPSGSAVFLEYRGEAGECECNDGAAGTVRYDDGKPAGCQKCPEGKYATAGTGTMCQAIPCAGDYAGMAGACTCAAGFVGTVVYQDGAAGGCVACPSGKWSVAGNGLKCLPPPCTGAYVGPSGSCVCAAGFFGVASISQGTLSGCEPCASGTWSQAGVPTCSPVSCIGHTGIQGSAGACECAPGYVGAVVYTGSELSGCNPQPCAATSFPNSNYKDANSVVGNIVDMKYGECDKPFGGSGFGECKP